MDHEETVYQYYTIVSDADHLIPDSDLNCIENVPTDSDNIMYLSLGQTEEEVYPPNIVLSGVKTEAEDEDAAAVANIELITLEDGQMYMTGTSGLNEGYMNNEELVQKEQIPEPVESEKTGVDSANSDNVEMDNDYRKIQLEDGTCAYIDKVLWHSLIDDMEKIDEEKATVAPKKEKKFRCTYYGCDKIYTTAHHLTVHLRNHTGSRPYECEEPGCVKAFATGYSLKAHQRTHTGEAPYCCAVCPKQFKTSGDLQKHIRTHTGEKPFKCPIEGCGRSFTTSNIRKVHIRSHTGERPYSCTYSGCGKAFASATNFKNHMRIHSGERPYQCSVPGCGKKFTEYSSLFKHNAVHKPFKPLKCEYCDKLCKHEMTLKAHKHAMHKILITEDGTEIHLTKEKSGNYFMSSTV